MQTVCTAEYTQVFPKFLHHTTMDGMKKKLCPTQSQRVYIGPGVTVNVYLWVGVIFKVCVCSGLFKYVYIEVGIIVQCVC